MLAAHALPVRDRNGGGGIGGLGGVLGGREFGSEPAVVANVSGKTCGEGNVPAVGLKRKDYQRGKKLVGALAALQLRGACRGFRGTVRLTLRRKEAPRSTVQRCPHSQESGKLVSFPFRRMQDWMEGVQPDEIRCRRMACVERVLGT